MNREIKSEVISRRSALSLLGMAALGLAVPTTVLTVSDAEAQQPAAPTAPAAAPRTGTERRQERRTTPRETPCVSTQSSQERSRRAT